MSIYLLSVDYQYDFCKPGGIFYRERLCHRFIDEVLIPYCLKHQIKISEIISDYSLPRPSSHQSYCVPGSWGYQSGIPSSLIKNRQWVKAMKSPEWIRIQGTPHAKPENLTAWFESNFGPPGDQLIIVFGLTLDCCVLNTVMQLYFRGYLSSILIEATDIDTPQTILPLLKPGIDYKTLYFQSTIGFYATPILWQDLCLSNFNLEKIDTYQLRNRSKKIME